MVVIDKIAKDLHMKPADLMKESLRDFLNKRLRNVEAEFFLLAKKYGVKDIFEFDEMVKKGKFSEEESFEDYFKFDHLEAERDKIKKYLEKI